MLTHVFIGSLPPIDYTPLHMSAWWPFTGSYLVGVFFVVSGFALSIGFLQNTRRKQLLRMIGGRYVRLLVPILATCALVSVFLNLGIIPASGERLPAYVSNYAFNPTADHVLWFSFWGVFFDFDFAYSYAGPLWTMAYELIGSYSLFALMLFVPQGAARRAVCLGIGFYLLATDSVYCWFFFGMAAAELYLWLQNRQSIGRYAEKVGWFLLALGFYLPLNVPAKWDRMVLLGVVCWFLGSMLVPTMRALMSSRISLFLGKLSFPLYLVHEAMIVAVGGPLYMGATTSLEKFLAGLAVAAASMVLAMVFVPIDTLGQTLSRKTGTMVVAAAEAVWRRTKLAVPAE